MNRLPEVLRTAARSPIAHLLAAIPGGPAAPPRRVSRAEQAAASRFPAWPLVVLLPLAFALCVGPAASNELRLAWGTCHDAGGDADIAMPCEAGGPPVTLYLSFELTEPFADLVAIDFSFNVHADAAALPAFWDFRTDVSPSSCNGGLSMAHGTAATCPGHVASLSGGTGVLGYAANYGPSGGLVMGTVYDPALSPGTHLTPGSRYVVAAITIDPSWAVEAGGTCAGCATPIRFAEADVERPLGDRPRVSLHSTTGRSLVVSGLPCVTANGGGDLACVATAARTSTWGRLKSLYR